MVGLILLKKMEVRAHKNLLTNLAFMEFPFVLENFMLNFSQVDYCVVWEESC